MKPETAHDKILQEMLDLGVVSGIDAKRASKYITMAIGVGFNIGTCFHSNSKAVTQYDKNGKFMRNYNSAAEAERNTPYIKKGINRCCNGVQRSSGGFIWKFQTI